MTGKKLKNWTKRKRKTRKKGTERKTKKGQSAFERNLHTSIL